MAAKRIIRNGDSLEFCTRLPEMRENIESPPFSLMDNDWKFRFTKYSSGPHLYYDVHIELVNAGNEFRWFKFDFNVRLNDESNSILLQANKTFNVQSKKCCFWYIRSDNLAIPSSYRTGNIIQFWFCFYLPQEPVLLFHQKSRDKCAQTSSYLNADAALRSLASDFSELFNSGLYHDVEIKCGELSIKAHKNILSARSEVFKVMLQSDMLEGRTGIVNVKDINTNCIQDFVKYLYTDELSELTFEKAFSLYEAGDKYDVRSLMVRCSEYLQDNLSPENTSQCLALADAHHDKNLVNKIVAYISEAKLFNREEFWSPICEKYPKIALEVYRLFHKGSS